MNKRELIIAIIVIGIFLVVGFFWFIDEMRTKGDKRNEDCVPASCCHSSKCVWENEAPSCDGAFCTMSCEPGTMDCGSGNCEIVDGECGVVWNE